MDFGDSQTPPTFIVCPAVKENYETYARLQQILQHKVGQLQQLHFVIDSQRDLGSAFYSRFSSNLVVLCHLPVNLFAQIARQTR